VETAGLSLADVAGMEQVKARLEAAFLNAGIPALSIWNGEHSGDGKRSGSQVFADYMRDVHHTPRDSIDQAIDWQAAATEVRFVFVLGDQVAGDQDRPRFNSTAFFTTTP